MKILLTGGGTGGHFYPIIAIAQKLNKLIKKEKLIHVDLVYASDTPYNERLLFENGITFKKISAGKMRRYASLKNITDMFKTAWGALVAVFSIYKMYPDVVISKGGYASFPTVFAARILRIPVIIHESDSVPERVNKWAGKFAVKVAVSYPDAAAYFPKEKVAVTGNPVREDIMVPIVEGSHRELGLDPAVPTILILGGSQGSRVINEHILEIAPKLTEKYQIIHQTGMAHMDEIQKTAHVLMENAPHPERYKIFGYLNGETMRRAAGVSNLVISRAGSAIFEIALWGIPAIIIPISDSNGGHQRKNAFAYARAGAADVIEESNLSPSILASEIERIMADENKRAEMSRAARDFGTIDAADKIAEAAIQILLEHQK